MGFKQKITGIAQEVVRDAIALQSTYKFNQSVASDKPAIGVVKNVDGATVLVEFPDGSRKTVQIGNRDLVYGDLTPVFGGTAH